MWKTVSVDEKYEVNEFGDVRYKGKTKLKIPHINKQNGYLYVQLWDTENNTNHRYPVHRLVAMAFIPNPENKPTVDHINHIRTDNHVSNLRWATYKEQNITVDGVGLSSIKVKATSPNGDIIYFPNKDKAGEYFGVSGGAIKHSIYSKQVVKKGVKKGWFFEYVK